MAGNIYGVLGSARQGFEDADAMTQTIRRRAAGMRAAPRAAAGDYRGAAGAYAEQGLDEGAAAYSRAQEGADDQAYDRGRLQTQDARADSDHKVRVLVTVAQGLKHIPSGQRLAALRQAYPLFQAAQIDTSHFDQLTEDQLTDQGLDAFTGEVRKHVMVNLGNGGVGDFDPATGDMKTLREPTERAPAGFEYDDQGNLSPIPGYVAGRHAIAEATRAPPRPRAGGGGGRGGGAGPQPVGGPLTIDPNAVRRR
jgi:hypothetical protein